MPVAYRPIMATGQLMATISRTKNSFLLQLGNVLRIGICLNSRFWFCNISRRYIRLKQDSIS